LEPVARRKSHNNERYSGSNHSIAGISNHKNRSQENNLRKIRHRIYSRRHYFPKTKKVRAASRG
jgi:hypothetical protein